MNTEIVTRIWRWGSPGMAYIPIQKRPENQWDEREPTDSRFGLVVELPQPENYDYYFSPLTFDGARKNANVVEPIRVLYADLDESHPATVSPRPTIAWETSPGMYQAVWLVNEYMTRAFFEQINKRLTYATGADKGGWHPSKVLRVPGSINWKRGGVKGRVLWNENRYVSVRILDKLLPEAEALEVSPDAPPAPALPTEELWEVLYQGLPPGLKYLLNKAPAQSRSEHMWRLIQEMKEYGYSPPETFQVLWFAPANKYRDQRRPHRLWEDITRAYFG